MRYGAIEAGGTKFVLGVSDEKFNLLERISIPTSTPETTLKAVFAFFDENPVDAIGIGSFGPIDINSESATWGFVKNTPKPGWKDFDFMGAMKKWREIPYAWTTDVNAAALGEQQLGAAKGYKSMIYLTVGTGIGGGIIQNNKFLEGFGHSETGHIISSVHPSDQFAGCCPYHKNCLEGMAAGPAIEQRWGVKGVDLPADHKAWDLEAFYLAQALVNYTMMISPEIIVLGGGVMHQEQLFPKIRQEFAKIMNSYMDTPKLDDYIVKVKLGDNAGAKGCFLLAELAAK